MLRLLPRLCPKSTYHRLCLAACRHYSGQPRGRPQLTFFTKDECSLCVPAKEIMYRCAEKAPANISLVDITAAGNEKWFELYKYDIPVLHLNDRLVMKHRFDEGKLLLALQRAQDTGRGTGDGAEK